MPHRHDVSLKPSAVVVPVHLLGYFFRGLFVPGCYRVQKLVFCPIALLQHNKGNFLAGHGFVKIFLVRAEIKGQIMIFIYRF